MVSRDSDCPHHRQQRAPRTAAPAAALLYPGRARCVARMRFLLVALAPAGALAVACETTKTGKKCAAWGENDFGLVPTSTRCAQVDGLKEPWCYYGDGESDWGYCAANCEPRIGATVACSTTVGGKSCEVWGENDFGLDPSSNSCEKVDGLDRPWCFTGEDAWDYCACETTSAQRKDDTVKVSTGGLDGLSGDGEGSEVQAGDTIKFKDLMLQGKVTRWWWDSLNPNTDRLTDVNFDTAITRSDYYAVFFFSPFCASCKDLSVEWDKLAATFARTRTDTAFGRVNCGHGDQTYRPPTEEELDAGDPAAWGEYKDSNGNPLEGMRDGEVVCNWYKVVKSPTLVFFNPNSQRPKHIDAPMTVTGISDWINEEIAKSQAQLGRSGTDGLTPFGLELANTPVEESGCDNVRQVNKNLRSDVEQFERNQAVLEDKVEELEDMLKELGHDEL